MAHGLPVDVATDPKNRGRFQAEVVTDFAQEALYKFKEQFEKQMQKAEVPTAGLIYRLKNLESDSAD